MPAADASDTSTTRWAEERPLLAHERSSAEGVSILCTRAGRDRSFNGPVRVQEACTAKQTQLDPSALGLLATPRAFGTFSSDSGPIIAVVLGGTSIPLATVVAHDLGFAGSTLTLATPGHTASPTAFARPRVSSSARGSW